MFGFIASFIYDYDAPVAERRATALTLDRELLREMLGEELGIEPSNAERRAHQGLHDLSLCGNRHVADQECQAE